MSDSEAFCLLVQIDTGIDKLNTLLKTTDIPVYSIVVNCGPKRCKKYYFLRPGDRMGAYSALLRWRKPGYIKQYPEYIIGPDSTSIAENVSVSDLMTSHYRDDKWPLLIESIEEFITENDVE